MNKEIATVYETDDLSIFKVLMGNRDISDSRKKMLVKSIKDNGYITNPIIVNEKYEVIDGQGRLAACKELNVPICYVIVPYMGVDECMVLNMNAKNWTINDYIKSYADQGREDYKRLLNLSGMGVGVRTFMFANGIYGGSMSPTTITKGHARSSEETYKNASEAIKYLLKVKPFTDKIIGRAADLESAVLFAYYDKACDNTRLTGAISKYFTMINPIAGLANAMDELAKVYNFRLVNKPRLYLKEDFDRFMHDRVFE